MTRDPISDAEHREPGASTPFAALSITTAFLEALVADRAAGRRYGVEHYQRRFPGHEAVIAREFARVGQGGAKAPTGPVLPSLGDEPDGTGPPTVDAILDRLDHGPERRSRYCNPEFVGAGGMARVYRVWDMELQRPVALKVMRRRIGRTPGGAARFLAEVQITGQLSHPSIPAVHEVGRTGDGDLYYAMAWVHGTSFAHVLADARDGDTPQQAWDLGRALAALRQACDTLAYAHSRGVIHRDVKPANLIVGRFGEAFVMDWGLARTHWEATESTSPPVCTVRDCVVEDPVSVVHSPPGVAATGSTERASGSPIPRGSRGSAPLTQDGDVLGTPEYMPPEQSAGDARHLGPAADVFALGRILEDILSAFCDPAPAPLRSIAERATAVDPGARFPDAAAMSRDLQAFLDGRAVSSHPTGALAELRLWIRRNRATAATAALALAALFGGLGWSLWERSRAQTAADRAEQSRQLADTQAVRAEAHLGAALDASSEMVRMVLDDDLRMLPDAEPVMRNLAERAVEFTNGLAAKEPEAKRIRIAQAEAHQQRASMHHVTGEFTRMIGDLQTADRIFTDLSEEAHGDRNLRLKLLEVRKQLGLAHWNHGDIEAGLAVLLPTADELEGMVAEGRPTELVLDLYASSLTAIGNCLHRAARHQEELVYRRRAVAHARTLFATERNRTRHIAALGSTLGNLGLCMQRLGQLPQAVEVLSEAMDLLNQGLAEAPGHRDLRITRANTAVKLGPLLKYSKRLEEAAAVLADACKDLDALVGEHPQVATYEATLAAAQINYCNVLRSTGQREAALGWVESGIDHVEIALRISPDQQDWLGFRRNGHAARTEILANLKRYPECERAIADRLALPGITPQERGYCGYLLAFCSRYCHDEDAATRMAAAALPELLAAWTAGYTFMPKLADGVYDRLRGLDDFPALERAAAGAHRQATDAAATGR